MNSRKNFIKKFCAATSALLCLCLLFCSCGQLKPPFLESIPLSNPNANPQTQAVYQYIQEISGKYVLAAQQESTWMDSADYEINYIFEKTGKYPSIRGLDYMDDDFDGVNQRAIAWWNSGGLVTICWHMGSDFSGAWSEAMESTVADWDAMLTKGTPEHQAALAGMDKAASALKQLQEQGVVVLWRPFHEFDGAWFWWGKGGSQRFVQLWQMMYDYFTVEWELDNLIWVLGYSHMGENCAEWYPGDAYCDVIGADSYEGGAQPKLYKCMQKVTVTKPCCFHECGTNPTQEELQKVPWSWFMTWHTEHLTEQNDAAALNDLYNSDYVLTKDELPKIWEAA